jgi:hypothetical protein
MSTGKSQAVQPQQPNPFQVAGAQTGSNVTTGIANSIMGNANETSPLGSVNTQIGGYQSLTDPSTGQSYQIPTFNRTTTLSPEQETLYKQQTALGQQGNSVASEQLNHVRNILNTPIDNSNLPPNVPNLGPPPGLNGIGTGPTLRNDLGPSNIQEFSGSAPSLQDTFGNAGPIQRGVNITGATGTWDTGGPQYGFNEVGGPQRNVGPTDFSQDRQRVEDALYSRLNPQLQRDRDSLESHLVNQGFQRGTEGFNQAMDEYNRQANDARMQTVLAGGQEQSRLAGLDFQKFGLENQAQAQDFGQQQQRGQFFNSAQQQATNQMAQRVQLDNAARQQDNAASLAAGQFADQAQQQQFQQNQAQAQFGNEARTQGPSNQVVANQAHNAANAQAFDQNAQAAQFYNTAGQQAFDNNTAATGFNNNVGQQTYQNAQTNADYQATARERALQEQLALRNQPLNEISTLMNGGQVTLPQFTQFRPGTIEPNTLGQNVYQGYNTATNAYNAQIQANAAARAGMFNLGAAALGAGTKAAIGGGLFR